MEFRYNGEEETGWKVGMRLGKGKEAGRFPASLPTDRRNEPGLFDVLETAAGCAAHRALIGWNALVSVTTNGADIILDRWCIQSNLQTF